MEEATPHLLGEIREDQRLPLRSLARPLHAVRNALGALGPTFVQPPKKKRRRKITAQPIGSIEIGLVIRRGGVTVF